MCSCPWPSWWESRMKTVSLWLNSSVSNSSSMSLWRTRNCLSWRTTESKDWIKSSKAKQSGYLWVMFESCFSSTSTKCSTKVLSYVFSLPQIRAEIISTYALCGFANFSSLGIVIGGLCRCFVIPSHCCPYLLRLRLCRYLILLWHCCSCRRFDHIPMTHSMFFCFLHLSRYMSNKTEWHLLASVQGHDRWNNRVPHQCLHCRWELLHFSF